MSNPKAPESQVPPESKSPSTLENIRSIQNSTKEFLDMLRLFKTKKESRIDSFHEGKGFLAYEEHVDYVEASAWVEKFEIMIKDWFSQHYGSGLKELHELLRHSRRDKPLTQEASDVIYCGGKCKGEFIFLDIRPSWDEDYQTGKKRLSIDYKKIKMGIGFTVAPSFVIMTETRSTFWTEQSHQRIVYLPPKLTEDHLQIVKENFKFVKRLNGYSEEPYKKLKN